MINVENVSLSGCGCGDEIKFDGVSAAYKRVLWAVIAINAMMFVVEMAAGAGRAHQGVKSRRNGALGTGFYNV